MPENNSALSAIPAAGARRGLPPSASLRYFYGPMDCGKSTLALQINYNHSRQGRQGLLLTQNDRSAEPQISSRMGMDSSAVDIHADLDPRRVVRDLWARGERVDYLIVDEAQFLQADQVDQLAELVDVSDVDVYAFGLLTDFRSALFPGSQRLLELADEITKLQVEVLCWCGRIGAFNGRVVDGHLVKLGAQVMVADTAPGQAWDVDGQRQSSDVRYQVLCRRHWRSADLGPGSSESQAALPIVAQAGPEN